MRESLAQRIPSCAHLAERRVAALDAIAPNVTCVVSRTAERHESAADGMPCSLTRRPCERTRRAPSARIGFAATLVVADA